MKKIAFILFCLLSLTLKAQEDKFSMELQRVNLPDALRYIAKLQGLNVIISPAVQGQAIMNLDSADAEDALNMLLLSHGLAKKRLGNLWLIAPHDELIKIKQQELKYTQLDEEASALASEVLQIHYAKALDIGKLLQDGRASLLSKRGSVRVDARTNIICIHDTKQRLRAIRSFIRKLDVPVKQISISARLVAVDCDYERELGIQFSTHLLEADEEKGHYSLALAKLADGSFLDVKLAALENAGRAELISTPGLFTANQQLASIESGEEVPYQEVSESGGTAVVFKKAVLALKVIPQVMPKNHILLKLQINQDRPSQKMVQGVPTINTRQIVTNVLAKSGETIVLGGIYEVNKENGESGLPFLGQIPVVGWLFKQQKIRQNKRELLIFVTPRVID
jgi:type IV pilus assembly protein PilQ